MGEGKGECSRGRWKRNGEGLKETVLEVGEKVYGTRKIMKGKRRKGSEGWSSWKKEGMFLNIEENKE